MGKKQPAAAQAPFFDSWTVERICAVLIFAIAFCLSGRMMPGRSSSSDCTAQQGMCTLESCQCTAPLVKRELMTEDSTPCFQCVSAYCPAFAAGNNSCSAASCECEDPSWERHNVGVGGVDCWQCQQPPIDLTLRPGELQHGQGQCFVESRSSSSETNGSQRLDLAPWNSSDCSTFKFNGAWFQSKESIGNCLAWVPRGGFWGLLPCDQGADFPGLFIQQAAEDRFCTAGAPELQHCVEPVEFMCTTDSTHCSIFNCRCEDPTMVRQERQTFNSTRCYSCAPPEEAACPVTGHGCLPSCECRQDGYVKVQQGGKSCYSCSPRSSALSLFSTIAIFLLCVSTGAIVGGGLKRLLVRTVSPSSKGHRRQLSTRRSWVDQCLDALEDFMQDAVEAAGSVRIVSRSWAFMGRVLDSMLDEIDRVLQVFDPVFSTVMNVWDRLAAAGKAAWVAFKDEQPSGAKSRPKRQERKAARAQRSEKPASVPSRVQEANPSVRAAAVDARPRAGAKSPEAQPTCESQEDAEAKPTPFMKAFSQCLTYAKEQAEDLDWDPLNVSGKSKNSAASTVTIPQEWMMRLVPPAAAAVATTKQRAQTASSAATALPTQKRALKRLQQRREAAAAAAAASQPLSAFPKEAEATLDESWIDEMEMDTRKEREAKEARAAHKKEKKTALRARRTKPNGAAEAEADADEETAGASPGDCAPSFEAEAASPANEGGEEEEEDEEEEQAEDEAVVAEETEEDEEEDEADEAADVAEEEEEDGNDTKSVQSADAAGGGSAPREVVEPEKAKTSQHVEDLLRMVGTSGCGAGVSGQSDELFNEAMHGLMLLASEGSDAMAKVVQEQPQAVVGDADAGAGDANVAKAAAAAAGGKKKQAKEGRQQAPLQQQFPPAQEEATRKDQPQQSPKQLERPKASKEVSPAAPKASPAPAKPNQGAPQAAPSKPATVPQQAAELPKPTPSPKPQAAPPQHQPQPQSQPQKQQPTQEAPERKPRQQPAAQQQQPQQPQQPQQRKPPTQAPWARKPENEVKDTPKPAPEQEVKEAPKVKDTPKAAPEQEVKEAPKVKDTPKPAPEQEVKEAPKVDSPAKMQIDEVPPTRQVSSGSKPLAADAPDFVPFSMMTAPTIQEDVMRARRAACRQQASQAEVGEQLEQSLPITTVMVSGIPAHHTSESFRQQLDAWGLMGTYNFFYMPSESHLGAGYAFVNFIDPTFAQLCQMLFEQYQFEGTVTPFKIQGLENNIAHWNQFEDSLNTPVVINAPTPSQWAVNGVNTMLNSKFSPQIREQFHKTKLCVFHKKNKCALGTGCPFAHTREELQPTPDLAKTKLCYNFFRRRCNDSQCKFAHGYKELRATNNIYKTELCRWWSYGGCKAGSACRYAHGIEELRKPPNDIEGLQFDAPEFLTGMEGGEEGMDFMEMYGHPLAVPPLYEKVEETYNQFEGLQQSPAASWPLPPAQGRWQDPQTEVSKSKAPQPAQSESLDDGKSDMGLSDVSFSLDKVMDQQMRRQQTAPPTSATSFISELPRLNTGNDIVLRVKGTFMEAMQVDVETARVPMHRSWSDGDLPQLCEVMECMEDYDDEC